MVRSLLVKKLLVFVIEKVVPALVENNGGIDKKLAKILLESIVNSDNNPIKQGTVLTAIRMTKD